MSSKKTTDFAGLEWTKKKRNGKEIFKKKKSSLENEGDEIKRLTGNYKNVINWIIDVFGADFN